VTQATIYRAANDPDLRARVESAAHQEAQNNPSLADTTFGKQLRLGVASVLPLMWGVAVDTEAAYETAVNSGRGAPGHDVDIITDGNITSAVVAAWPYAEGEVP
jgi:hypothetical protein